MPFVSPDGQWVGYSRNTSLNKIAIIGGPPVRIATIDGTGGRGATWGDDESIIFATNSPLTGLQQVPAAGGVPRVLTTPNRDNGENDHLWPEFLPGSEAVLFTISTTTGGVDDSLLAVLDLRTYAQTVLVRGGSHGFYVGSGHLVYRVGTTLRAVPFDPRRLQVTGVPVSMIEEVAVSNDGAVDAAVAANGTLVYALGGAEAVPEARRSLVWVDRAGVEEPLPAPERPYRYPRLPTTRASRSASATRRMTSGCGTSCGVR